MEGPGWSGVKRSGIRKRTLPSESDMNQQGAEPVSEKSWPTGPEAGGI